MTKELHIAIVGLGPSDAAYLDTVKRMGGRHAFCDEVWAINNHGASIDCDLVVHMDDLKVQEIRAEANPTGNIAAMVDWLKSKNKKPVLTSVPRMKGHTAFPLEKAMNTFQTDYFNNTAAYAVAFAILRGATLISLFGIDYTYPNAHDAEQGRGCTEFWIGIAMARGIRVQVPSVSTLLDANVPEEEKPYGYDAVIIERQGADDGTVTLKFVDRPLPTATEIEDRYDHTKHPAHRIMMQQETPR